MTNICIKNSKIVSLFCLIFSNIKILLFRLSFILYYCTDCHLLKTFFHFFHSISIFYGGHLGVFGPILTYMSLCFLRTIQHFFKRSCRGVCNGFCTKKHFIDMVPSTGGDFSGILGPFWICNGLLNFLRTI